MAFKKIAIVANKWWEADPLCGVLLNANARPEGFRDFALLDFPKPKPKDREPPDPATVPRMRFRVGADCEVDVWCVEHLMNPRKSSSSSFEKARVLKTALTAQSQPDLVIAFGTAGSAEHVKINGSVVIGTRVFIHNPDSPEHGEQDPPWIPDHADTVMGSDFKLGTVYTDTARFNAEARLIQPPVNPAPTPMIFAGDAFVSIGVVNIINYDNYVWADKAAIARFAEAGGRQGQVGCVETTHGLIRSMTDKPFIYVSGISDTEGLFSFEVTPRQYAQNFVAAHNAAVALAWLLPALV